APGGVRPALPGGLGPDPEAAGVHDRRAGNRTRPVGPAVLEHPRLSATVPAQPRPGDGGEVTLSEAEAISHRSPPTRRKVKVPWNGARVRDCSRPAAS